jgi:hypothetical protein
MSGDENPTKIQNVIDAPEILIKQSQEFHKQSIIINKNSTKKTFFFG